LQIIGRIFAKSENILSQLGKNFATVDKKRTRACAGKKQKKYPRRQGKYLRKSQERAGEALNFSTIFLKKILYKK
jgi:hypothetical protein